MSDPLPNLPEPAPPEARSATPVGAASPAPVAPRKPRKSGCGCMFPLLLLGLLIGFAPRIISQTVLRNQVPAMLMAELPPGVEIGSATVGWSTPIALNDVIIPDDQGHPALRAKHVTLSVSLWELARGVDDYGTIVIEEPQLDLRVEKGVTNFDRFLGRLSGGSPSTGPLPQIDLQIKDGTVTLREEPLTTDKTPEAERPAPLAIVNIPRAGMVSSTTAAHDLTGQLVAAIQEPAVELPVKADFHWDLPQAGVGGIGNGQILADVPSLPLKVLAPWIEPYTSGRAVSGEFALRAAMDVVPSPEGQLLIGADVTLPRMDFRLSAPVLTDGSLGQPYRWQGTDLQLVAEGAGDLAGKLVTFETVRLRTPIANADFRGTVADLPGQVVCNLTGTSNIDIQELLALIPPEQAQNIQFNNLRLGEIQVQGPLRVMSGAPPAAPLLVSTDLQWDAANFYGFTSKDALVTVLYTGEALEINPHRLPIGSGQWVAAPRVEFGSAGSSLVFAGGPVLEGIEFTPEMSATWLRYVSPLLGSSTSIEGRFSLSAEPARIQLAPPYAGQFSGVLEIESAQAGPGPMVLPILESIATVQSMLGRKTTLSNQKLTVAPQNVPFQYADGRVAHQNLQVGMGDILLTSSGSVGLDETIDFQMTMPLPNKWTEGRPLLAGLKGESIPFVMTGTLDSPQLDRRALGEFGQRIGAKGAAGLLDGLIQRRQEKVENGTIRPAPRRNR